MDELFYAPVSFLTRSSFARVRLRSGPRRVEKPTVSAYRNVNRLFNRSFYELLRMGGPRHFKLAVYKVNVLKNDWTVVINDGRIFEHHAI